jgi:hypothetical protein
MVVSGRQNRLSFSVSLALFLPYIVTKFLIYEISMCNTNVHKHKFLCLFLHVSAEAPFLGSLYANIPPYTKHRHVGVNYHFTVMYVRCACIGLMNEKYHFGGI